MWHFYTSRRVNSSLLNDCFFLRMEVLDGSSLEENEANFFAAELLLEDSEVLEFLSEYSFF